VAYAVSAIAAWDWPEAWPDLFQILMHALTSGDTNAVHGAMRVLAGMYHQIMKNYMYTNVHVRPQHQRNIFLGKDHVYFCQRQSWLFYKHFRVN